MNKNLEQLTKIIQEAVPDIECRNTSVLLKGIFTGLINYKDDTISLADVLRAIGKKQGEGIYPSVLLSIGHPASWDLSKPLHLQSQETVDFLLSILT